MGRRGLDRGFTIIELLTVVAIIGVLASLALPAFDDLIKNSRRTTVVNELSSSLMLARAEAAKQGLPMVVCGVDDANNNRALEASEQACAGTDWRDGWIVASWADANNDSVLDSGELQAPMKIYLVDYADVRVTGSAFSAAPATGAVALMPFNRTGTTATFTICDKRGATRARAVAITRSGRASVVINNTEDAATGAALTCP